MEEGLILSLEFTEFDIACPYTYLAIMDEDGLTLMEKSCGPLLGEGGRPLDEGNILVVGGQNITSVLPPNVRSRSNTVNIIFITERYVGTSGWSLTWSAIQPGGSIFI